jgi:hypothetical protein
MIMNLWFEGRLAIKNWNRESASSRFGKKNNSDVKTVACHVHHCGLSVSLRKTALAMALLQNPPHHSSTTCQQRKNRSRNPTGPKFSRADLMELLGGMSVPLVPGR